MEARISSGKFSSVDEFAVAAAGLYRNLNSETEELREEIRCRLEALDHGDGIETSTPEQKEAMLMRIKQERLPKLSTQDQCE
ncbi:MAG: hypothetical protein KDA37_08165 [Planctomycetales bacterium]|nr:hypothetical protein [Planctomycetales bacterium]